MKTLQIQLPGREYNIDIGNGILDQYLAEFIQKKGADQVVIVTNETLQELYPDRIEQVLQNVDVKVSKCVLPDGEEYKNLETLSQIFDFLMESNANRKTILIAFGGGVIGDMAGFAAATFMRSIPFIQVPTTLLAHVDSSVGGKTAVNHPRGKNTIGSFKQPEYVCIDLAFLKTLAPRELKAGYFELLKHGFIQDPELLEFVQNHDLEPLDFEFLEEAVFRSCTIKGRVVQEDETESGIRALLNFGHTLGHLIETHTGYGTYLHGEAVGTGMCFAAFVSWRWGHLDEKSWQFIRDFLSSILKPVELPPLDEATFRQLILHDKKAEKKAVNFILLNDLGKSFISQETSVSDLWSEYQQFITDYPHILKELG